LSDEEIKKVKDDDSEEEVTQIEDYSKFKLAELEEMLNKAIEDEAFEKASRIRDEIEKLRKKKR